MVRLIAGIVRRDGREAERRLIEEMLAAMNPEDRPAATDVVISGPAGFGVIELVSGHGALPGAPRIVSTASGLLAADVVLHDRGKLGSLAPADRDDADVVAAALSAWGWRAPARLHGDFAYAHWNRETGAVELVRDHWGIRPLQYAERKGSWVAFASLPAAFLRTGLVERRLDAEALRFCHVSFYAPGERTFYEPVRCALPAHVTRLGPEGDRAARRYWRLPIPARLPFGSDGREIAAEMRRLLDQAVRRRLPASGPVAAELSGGLDSTPIAVLAARALREQGRALHAFAMQESREGVDLPVVDEAPYVAEVAAAEPNLVLAPIPLRGYGSVICGRYDIDTFHSLAGHEHVNTLLRGASESGAGVLFSGWGGDELVTNAGIGAYAELFWAGEWRLLRRSLEEVCGRLGGTFRGRLLWNVAIQSVPLRVRQRLLGLVGKADPQRSWMDAEPGFLPAHRRGPIGREPVVNGPDTRRNRRAYAESWWMPKRLENHAQQAARHGMRYVFPMLDLDLAEFSMRVPGLFFSQPLGDRSLIRMATEGILPDSVRLRTEKLMPYPLALLRLAEERGVVIETLRALARRRLVRDFVDVPALCRHFEAMPDADAVRNEIVRAAEKGEQSRFGDPGTDANAALKLAVILAQVEDALSPSPNREEAGVDG